MNWVIPAVLLLLSCSADVPAAVECRRTDDCDGALCVGGRCRVQLDPTDWDDVGATIGDQGNRLRTPAVSGPCASATRPTADTLVLNEVLAHVPTGPMGDANDDGIRDAYEDEFIELVNVSSVPLDLRGVRISSGGKLKHAFESICVLPGEGVVVFGGGSVGLGVPGNVVVSDTRFAFANDGGDVQLSMPDGAVTSFEYGRTAPTSLTRLPQLHGPQWVDHLQLSTLPFSPGRCPDGGALTAGCVGAPASSERDAGAD